MIKVYVNKDKIVIKGHALYDDFGKDIVCASVSSILYTTINAIKNIKEDAISFVDESVFEINILNHDKITDILIDNMIVLLDELVKLYPKNIKIVKGE